MSIVGVNVREAPTLLATDLCRARKVIAVAESHTTVPIFSFSARIASSPYGLSDFAYLNNSLDDRPDRVAICTSARCITDLCSSSPNESHSLSPGAVAARVVLPLVAGPQRNNAMRVEVS